MISNPDLSFTEIVLEIVAKIPTGKVMAYGQVAAAAGNPRAARQVGNILGGLGIDSKLPWWRVVNSKGYISIRGHSHDAKSIQAQLLVAEGIEVIDNQVDIGRYQFRTWSSLTYGSIVC